MANISGVGTLSFNDLYTSDATQVGPYYVGTMMPGPSGRWYRYSLVGASTLVAGNLIQASAQDTTYENMTIGTAGVAGDAYLQVTNGTSTITSQQFEGGTVGTYTAGTVAVGDEYMITGVIGTLTSGGALKVYTDHPLRYAFSTAAKVNMKRSPWSGVIQFPVTTQTEMPVGVAIFANTAAQYGWVQTHGPATALSDNSTFAVGSQLSPSLAVAGAVGVNVAGTTHGIIGWARQAAASTHAISIFLQID